VPNAWHASLTVADRSNTAHCAISRRLRWRYHFFVSASATISALRRSSTYIVLRRRFSSSSSFVRAISDGIHPAEFGGPLVERSVADAMLAVQL